MPSNETRTAPRYPARAGWLCTGLWVVAACGTAGAAEPGNNWASKLASGLNLARGNSESALITLDGDLNGKINANGIKATVSFAYGNTDGTKSQDKGSLSGKYSRDLEDVVYVYAGTDWSYDTMAMLEYRLVTGPGGGFHLVKTNNLSADLETGLSYISEQTSEDAAGAKEWIAARIANRFEWKINEHATTFEAAEFLASTKAFGSYLFNAEAGVETAIAGRLSLRTSLKDKFDSTPADGVKKNDFYIIVALVCSFKSEGK